MRKHILIISQYFYPEQFRINDLAFEWARMGYKVTVVTGIPNYPKGKFYHGYGTFKKRHETVNGVEIIRLPIISRGKSSIRLILNYLVFVVSGFIWKMFTHIRADSTFIFEVSPMTQALVGVWYAKRRKIPCYLYVQDLWPENVEMIAGIHNQRILGMIGRMVDYIYKRCSKILVTSMSFAKSIEARGINGGRIEYVPQYAESFYQPSLQKSNLIKNQQLCNITFTGNIGTAQGLEILPEAAQILKKRNFHVIFNIVGDGRNRDNLLDRIKEDRVEDYFNFVGWQQAESIPSILSASDAAFLSFSEIKLFSMTIPAKLQSYLACGIPILAAVSGESKEIIEDAGCGIVCKSGDSEALASAIIRFMQLSEDERKQMSQNALRYSKEHFDRGVLVEKMLNMVVDDG